MTLEAEMSRLRALRERSAAVDAAIKRHRADILRCIRETGEARVAGAMDADENPAKVIEAQCKKLESQRLAAQSELDKLTPEVAPLAEAIQRIEKGIGGQVHTKRIEKQSQVRKAYATIAIRLLETANLLEELSGQARKIFEAAQQEFPATEEQYAGQESVFRAAGLRQVWDPAWVKSGPNGTRRDVVVGAIYAFNSDLVNSADPVAIARRHQEKFFRERAAEYESERQTRLNPAAELSDKPTQKGVSTFRIKVDPRRDGRPHQGQ